MYIGHFSCSTANMWCCYFRWEKRNLLEINFKDEGANEDDKDRDWEEYVKGYGENCNLSTVTYSSDTIALAYFSFACGPTHSTHHTVDHVFIGFWNEKTTLRWYKFMQKCVERTNDRRRKREKKYAKWIQFTWTHTSDLQAENLFCINIKSIGYVRDSAFHHAIYAIEWTSS